MTAESETWTTFLVPFSVLPRDHRSAKEGLGCSSCSPENQSSVTGLIFISTELAQPTDAFDPQAPCCSKVRSKTTTPSCLLRSPLTLSNHVHRFMYYSSNRRLEAPVSRCHTLTFVTRIPRSGTFLQGLVFCRTPRRMQRITPQEIPSRTAYQNRALSTSVVQRLQ